MSYSYIKDFMQEGDIEIFPPAGTVDDEILNSAYQCPECGSEVLSSDESTVYCNSCGNEYSCEEVYK